MSSSAKKNEENGDVEKKGEKVETDGWAKRAAAIGVSLAKEQDFDGLSQYLCHIFKIFEKHGKQVESDTGKSLKLDFINENLNNRKEEIVDNGHSSSTELQKLRLENDELRMEMQRMKQECQSHKESMILDRIKQRLNDQLKLDNKRLYIENNEWQRRYKALSKDSTEMKQKLKHEKRTNQLMSEMAMQMIDLNNQRQMSNQEVSLHKKRRKCRMSSRIKDVTCKTNDDAYGSDDEMMANVNWTDNKDLTHMSRCIGLQQRYDEIMKNNNNRDNKLCIKLDNESIDKDKIEFMAFDQFLSQMHQAIETFIRLNENKLYLFNPKIWVKNERDNSDSFYSQNEIIEVYSIDESNNQGCERLNNEKGLRSKEFIHDFTVLGQLCGNELFESNFEKLYEYGSKQYYQHMAKTMQVNFLTDDTQNGQRKRKYSADHFWIDSWYCNCDNQYCDDKPLLTYINDCRKHLYNIVKNDENDDNLQNENNLSLRNVEFIGTEVNGWPMIFCVTIKPIEKNTAIWSHFGADYADAMGQLNQ